MVKICVSGCKGRMGSRIVELSKDDAEIELVGSFDVGEDASGALNSCDCLIEFTTPEATMEHLEICEKRGIAMVIGTTGLSETDQQKVAAASKNIPVVLSPNMSIAVNLLFKLIADAAKVLGSEYAVEIIEAHHVNKKDSPSGTAKEMARIVRESKGSDIDIPIESIREDDIVGEHTITFDSDVDTLEITHSAKTRDIFARGALRAAKFIAGKAPGLYTMKDVLSL
ncbi:MAG: 4-hydroxy-tetrahydrodipicolinate reductase [Candidatus Omnitrophica bacterium]|nr:4-hydroxy-tetrahydrodipicolinate reductase [Candidatus Omnitrophota bacterium]